MASIKFVKICFYALVGIFFLSGCGDVYPVKSPEISTTPFLSITKTIAPSKTPEAPKLSATIFPTFTAILPAPTGACARETINPNAYSQLKKNVEQEILIAFESSQDGYDDIYVMNLDGTNITNITNHPAVDRFPIWSPDGKRIAFLSNRNFPGTNECRNMLSNECVFEVFIMNKNGANFRQIGKGWNFYPVWSPDSKQIAYSFYYPDPQSTPNAYGDRLFLSNIYLANTDGSKPNNINLTRQLPPGDYRWPVWSADSTKLAFVTSTGVTIVNVDGSRSVDFVVPNVLRILAWTKDNVLLFIDQDYEMFIAKDNFSIVQKLQLVHPIDYDSLIVFDPEMKWFIYQYSSGLDCTQIRIANIETSQDYFVYDIKDVRNSQPTDSAPMPSPLGISSIQWANNGRIIFTQWVTYPAIFGEFSMFFSINLDGSELRQVQD